ncbi:hypothetical protein ABID22_003639 [Pontibacter aydingkolensis]|uniref:Uncharacterized protein n=1 Tax=Pontibacter aydingkolensis TaxID=1911536 RepID=A0ABS7CYI5_9BACT|nr:hypothetical protein [Pontibacter aydingkolensis]MBW7468908.1 hypothetical protein [Pontibacter aydingkolensis]
MINFFRSLFGIGRPAGNRTVAGAPVAPDAKEAVYIKNSHRRLNTLNELYLKYKSTPHAEKIKAVLEKTKSIDAYLLAKKRVHELELFHIQHTDHFINTYAVIIEVYLRHAAPAIVSTPVQQPAAKIIPPPPPAPRQQKPKVYPHTMSRPFEDKVEDVLRKIENETIKGFHTAQKVTEMVRRVAGQAPYTPPAATMNTTKAQPLSVPVISIDTYSKIYYVKEQGVEGNVSGEIGFTSTAEEKEIFVAHIAMRLGIDQSLLKYLGNTILTIPGGPVAYMPVIYWKDCAYAISMHDYRLFPVNTYRSKR